MSLNDFVDFLINNLSCFLAVGLVEAITIIILTIVISDASIFSFKPWIVTIARPVWWFFQITKGTGWNLSNNFFRSTSAQGGTHLIQTAALVICLSSGKYWPQWASTRYNGNLYQRAASLTSSSLWHGLFRVITFFSSSVMILFFLKSSNNTIYRIKKILSFDSLLPFWQLLAASLQTLISAPETGVCLARKSVSRLRHFNGLRSPEIFPYARLSLVINVNLTVKTSARINARSVRQHGWLLNHNYVPCGKAIHLGE